MQNLVSSIPSASFSSHLAATAIPPVDAHVTLPMGTSPRRVQEETATASLRSSIGFLAAPRGSSPSLPTRHTPSSVAADATPIPRRSSAARRRQSGEVGPQSPANAPSSVSAPPPLMCLPLLSPLAGPVGSSKGLFGDAAAPSTPNMSGRRQGPGMSSSSTTDGAPEAETPPEVVQQPAASRPSSSTAGTARGAATRIAPNSSPHTTPLPKKLSTSALRGTSGLPEAVSAMCSALSPMSRSLGRLQAPSGSRTKAPCERDEDMTGSMGGASTDHNGLAQVPLPLIVRPSATVSSSFPGRLAAPMLHELGASGVAVMHSPMSASSVRRDEDGPQMAPALTIVIEASMAVGQPPPRPPHSLSLPASAAKRADISSTRPQGYSSVPQSGRRMSEADMSFADEENDEFVQDAGRRASQDSGDLSHAAPTELSMAGSGRRVNPDGIVTRPASTRASAALGFAVGATSSAAVTPFAKTDSRGFDAPQTEGTDGTRPASGVFGRGDSAVGEGDDGPSVDQGAAATAARGVTVVQGASDACDNDKELDASHLRKRAKRRLKKAQKGAKGKRHESAKAAAKAERESAAVAANGAHHHGDAVAAPSSSAAAAAPAAVEAAAVPHDAAPVEAAVNAVVDASSAAVASAGPPKSGSAIARKRERKRQRNNAKLKEMASEERRAYVEDHKRRRAAKKALREAEAAAASTAAVTGASAVAAPSQQAPQSEPPSNTAPSVVGDAEALATQAADAGVASSPARPPPLTDPRGGNLSDNAALVGLGAALSPQLLGNTCRPTVNASAGGGQALLGMLGQVRRCTSASGNGPSGSVPPLSILSPKSMSSLSPPFRRRFLSDATGLTPQQQIQQGRLNSFVYLSSSSPTRVAGAGAAAARAGATKHGFDDDSDNTGEVEEDLEVSSLPPPNDIVVEEDGVDAVVEDDDDSHATPLAAQTMRSSGEVSAVGAERVTAVPQLTAAVLTPHPPVSAAGSGAAAIHGLKQQQQQQQRSASPAVAGANDADELQDSGREVSEVSSLARFHMNQSDSSPLQQSSSAYQQPITEESHSVELEDNLVARDGRRHSGRDTSVSSISYYTSYSASRDRSEERGVAAAAAAAAKGPVAASRRAGAVSSRSSNSSRAPPVAAAQKAARRGRRSSASSCSSLRSRSGDSGSDSASSGYSSYSSSGSLQPEVLPLAEGCTVPPPAAAFSDLTYRYACVSQLCSYAEPAIIHEWDLTEGCWGSVETSVVLNPQPFSQGNMRASYYMIDMRRLNCLLVAKRYLKATVGDDQYFDDVSMHSIAGHWARVFNTMSPPKKVRFVPAAVLILPKRNPPLIVAMEPQLTGKFVKYNNNCGYVRHKARWTPQAFSHFTYHASEQTLMVVDIQGVDDYYTDPQILSPDGEGYGRGNLGKEGIRRFLQSHKCNEVCRSIGLPPLKRNAKGVVIVPVTPPVSGRPSAGPATPTAPDRLSSASGLKDERLPPKAFAQATRRGSSSNASFGGGNGEHQHQHQQHNHHQQHHHSRRSSASLDSRKPSVSGGAVLHTSVPPPGPPPPAPGPRQTLQTPSGHSSQSSHAGMTHSMQPVALQPRMGPAPNYGVKYVRYPRQALIRPQSQYFTSTAAGGLMAVPPQPPPPLQEQQQQQQGTPSGVGSGALTPHANALFASVTEQSGNATGNGKGVNVSSSNAGAGAPVGNSSMAHPPSTNGNVAAPSSTSGAVGSSPVGPAMLGVPLLRPPGTGVLGYAGGGSNGNLHGVAPMSGGAKAAPMIGPPKSGGDNFSPASPKSPGASPQLRPGGAMNKSGTGMPVFYPRPPPPPLQLQTASGQPPQPQRLPHQGSAAAVAAPNVPPSPNVRTTDRHGVRRHSFSRQPLFSAVEEMASNKSEARHHRRYPSHR